MATNADLPRQPKPLQQTFRSSKPRKLLALVAVLLLILIVPGIGGYLLGQRNSQPAFPSQSFISPEVKISTIITQSASIANLPPDPGEAGKATVAGIDSDHDGVR